MRTAIYIRVSTTDQAEEGFSLNAQKRRLIAYCESQEWIITEIYVDPGVSAKDLNRPDMQRMLSDMEKGLFDVVLTVKLDRLTRSTADCDKLLKMFEANGVKYQSASEPFETRTAVGRMFIQLVAVFAQFEREQLGERVRTGMIEKAQGGDKPGGRLAYGYNQDGTLNDEEAEELRTLRRLYVDERLSTRNVAWKLTLTSKRKWIAKDVVRVLRNKYYAGIVAYADVEVDGKHEALWTNEEFNEHFELVEGRSKSGRSRDTTYWFTGTLRCGRCGSVMFGKHINNKTKKDGTMTSAVYYRCLQKDTHGTCDFPMIRQAHAEHLLIEQINSIVFDRSLVEESNENMRQNIKAREKEMKRLERELIVIADRRKKWQYAFAQEAITIEDLRDRQLEENENELEVRRKLEEISLTEDKSEEVNKQLTKMSEVWPYLSDLEKQEVIRNIYKSIVVHTELTTVRGRKNQFFPATISVDYK